MTPTCTGRWTSGTSSTSPRTKPQTGFAQDAVICQRWICLGAETTEKLNRLVLSSFWNTLDLLCSFLGKGVNKKPSPLKAPLVDFFLLFFYKYIFKTCIQTGVTIQKNSSIKKLLQNMLIFLAGGRPSPPPHSGLSDATMNGFRDKAVHLHF